MGDPRRRAGARAPRGHGQHRAADRRGRAVRHRDRGAVGGQGAAGAGVRRAGLPGRPAPAVPLPRSAARDPAQEHHAAPGDHRVDQEAHDGSRVLRVLDADPHRVVARGRARFSRALAHSRRQVLRAAAGPAAVQAAADGVGLRPLLPDRAVLPRRGSARRPPAGRVLSARRGDELRRAGRHLRRHGAGDHRHLRGVRRHSRRRRREERHAGVAAHSLRRGDRQVRHRQAGPAQPDRDAGCDRSTSAARASRSSPA